VQKHALDDEQAKHIAFISDGHMEKVLSLIDEKFDSNFYTVFRSWILLCYKDDGINLIDKIEKDFSKMGRETQKSFLFYAINIMREVLLIKNDLHQMVHLTGIEETLAERFSDLFSHAQIEAAISLFEDASYNIERNANPKILFLDVSLQLILLFKYQTFPKGTQYI
jgi:DNA polymerase-3 subunit delta'